MSNRAPKRTIGRYPKIKTRSEPGIMGEKGQILCPREPLPSARKSKSKLSNGSKKTASQWPKLLPSTVCPPTKQDLAKHLGLSRSSLYYRSKKLIADRRLKDQIEPVLHRHPAYGHRRLAMVLRLNKKRILRVMRKFGLKPYRRRGRKWRQIKDFGSIYPNRFKTLGELAVAIYLQIHYDNTTRIHTKLKMPPTNFAAQQDIINQLNPHFPVHNVA